MLLKKTKQNKTKQKNTADTGTGESYRSVHPVSHPGHTSANATPLNPTKL